MSEYPTNPALEAAIVAHPDEDTPRLAYADWLDENGDPDRAEFIRVQCRLADMPPNDPDWVGLVERQDELVARLKHQFLTNVGKDADRFYFGHDLLDAHEEPFRRGFPYFIACQTSGAQWNEQEVERVVEELTSLVRTTTIRAFQPYATPTNHLARLLEAPVIAELTGLALGPVAVRNENADFTALYHSFCNNPSLREVKQLYLYHGTPPGAVAELAKAKTLGSVRRLTIQELKAPKPALEKLTKAPWFCRVQHFRCMLDTPAVAGPMLTGLGRLPELHTLDMPWAAASAAFEREAFPALARLMMPLNGDTAKHLSKGKLPVLTVLEAETGGVKNDGLIALLKAKWSGQLRVLNLADNGIGDKGVAALAAHPAMRTLRVLKLGDNAFGKSGLAAISTPGAFPALTTLSLRSYHKRKAKPADMAAFLSKLEMPNLRHLDLMGWPLGNAGAFALAANPSLAGLTRLNLDSCEIGDAGAKAIFSSPHLQNLVELHLDGNAIRTGADSLSDPAVLPRLGECWIGSNRIPKKAAEKLERDGLYLIT